MSRQQKLFDKLDALEARFRVLLGAELESETRDVVSDYLLEKRGSYRSRREPAEIDEVEDEIRALRAKAGESMADSWVSVVTELADRDSTANDMRYNHRIPRAAVNKILGSVRGADGLSRTKEIIRECLTTQKGSTGYSFSKEPLTKGLSYPIKRQALDQTILDSGTEEIHSVWYGRGDSLAGHRALANDELRQGELVLKAEFGFWSDRKININIYAIPSSESAGLKTHLDKTILPALRDWMKFAKTADIEWRSGRHFLEIGWQLGELRIRRE